MKYLEVLKDLISIDTTVPPGLNYDKAIAYLEPLFKKTGFDTRRLTIPAEYAEGREGRVNLVCHRRENGKPRLIFYGHIDVVPAEGWDAFKPRVENGKIYGRGAADMKGSIVALLCAMESLKGKHLDFDVSVMVTTDEEFSQASQLQYLRQYLEPVLGAYFLNLDSSFGYVSIAGLGVLQLDIKVTGKSVHSGLSHLGENAIEKASPLIQALLDLKHKVEQRKSKVPTHPDTKLNRMEGRLNINMIKGGIKTNIVPDECLISVDRRLIPEENLEDAKKELLDTLASVPGVAWQLERVYSIPTVPPADDPVIDRLARIIADTTGEGNKFGEMGSGDLSHIVAAWGCKAFGLGVIRPECNIHGKEEFVYLQDIEDVAKIVARFLSPQGIEAAMSKFN
jgi:succinyl-diaminopimelate desuccinylase